MHEILEDHLVELSELTPSDRPVEIPAAVAEKGPCCGRFAMQQQRPQSRKLYLSQDVVQRNVETEKYNRSKYFCKPVQHH